MHDYEDDFEDLVELSSDFYVENSCPLDINNARLKTVTEEEQFTALYEWFHARYCDPAHNTPYDGREGGYQWIHGGPYDAHEELEERFGEIVAWEMIDKVASHVCESAGIDEWAPQNWDPPEEDFYEIPIDEPSDIFINLKNNISNLLEVETLSGESSALQISRNLLFAGLITALEVYLYETVNFWINIDEELFKKLVTNLEGVKDKKTSYAEIFKVMDNLKIDIKKRLQQTVWHKERFVANTYKSVFNMDIDLSEFEEEILKRHHIVHRISKDFDGNEIQISKSDIQELADKIICFAQKIEDDLTPFQSRL